MTLDQLDKNKTALITKLDTSGVLLKKFYDMGFIEGSQIKLIRKSPLNDPIEVKISSYYITLRIQEAKCIKVRYE